MSTLVASRRVVDLEGSDTIKYTNSTGSDIANNQIVLIAGDTGFGIVGIAAGAIANGATGIVIIKMKVEFPAAAAVMTQGQTAQYVPSAASITVGGTATGTYAVGMVCDTIATSTGYVTVDLNFGPQAFKVW